jgi:hypothetical protein
MICIYLNGNGYYIKGDGIEVALSCSPNLDENGEPFYPEHCHVYAVLSKALNELRGQDLPGEIMVYNDSRVIDEMNGGVPPLDDLSGEFRNRIRREIMPDIVGTVFFRKKNTRAIAQEVSRAKSAMVDVPDKNNRLEELMQQHAASQRTKSLRALDKLKENWKNGTAHK